MPARVLDSESHFKIGDTKFLPKGPLLKRLTYTHCRTLRAGERIWCPKGNTGEYVATCVTAVKLGESSVVVHYNSSNNTGHITIEPHRTTRFYRFLDEEVLLPSEAAGTPRLRVVGED